VRKFITPATPGSSFELKTKSAERWSRSLGLFGARPHNYALGMPSSLETIPPKANRDRRGFPVIKDGIFPSTSR
jgi:hypothetical protein